MEVLLLYLLVGAAAGMIAGLLGLGGGAIIVPALILAFGTLGFSPGVLTHTAIGTSLATIVFTSLSAVYVHSKNKLVIWSRAVWLTIGVVFGAAFGAVIAKSMTGELLQMCFGLFLWFIAVQMVFQNRCPQKTLSLPGPKASTAAGSFIGVCSAIFGIGGGSLTVPYLSFRGVEMSRAVATSAVLGFPIALSGAISYVFTGYGHPDLPPGAFGFVYLPALGGIVVTSTPCARLGARLAARFPERVLGSIFAATSVVLGAIFILGNL